MRRSCLALVMVMGLAIPATPLAQGGRGAQGPQVVSPQVNADRSVTGVPSAQPRAGEGEWRPLFDGKTLDGWKETPFVARGKVSVEQGTVVLGNGYMTGITWTRDFPTVNYEIRYEAARMQGTDFFGALTFPVHGSFCTFVNGGWGGMIVGLSSLDMMDASENETREFMTFNRNQWYAFRVRVTDDSIAAWIDDEPVVSVNFYGREVGLRPGEIERSKPLGFTSYRTVGALRKIEYRLLPPARDSSR